ncbi:hypothetical protein [Hymenobacter bucti]|uniref:DUF1735 domain-containing protein n=1 Tax=Hymenobacter bucti TaxID=1844114 RepID=A0ABW4QZ96_9BACT
MRNIILQKSYLVLLAFLLLGAGSCKKILELLSFKVSDSSSFTIPGTPFVPPGVSLSIPGVSVPTTAQTTYKNNNTSAEYVQDVTLDQLTLTVTNPSTQNFNFLKSISIYIATNAAGSNKVLLASLPTVPTGQTSITLNPAGNKLDLYLKNSAYTLTTTAELAQTLRQNTDVRADSRFNVHANLP